MEEKILIEAKNLKKYFKVGANGQSMRWTA